MGHRIYFTNLAVGGWEELPLDWNSDRNPEMSDVKLKLQEHFEIEREIREQLSGRPGHQRCVVGQCNCS